MRVLIVAELTKAARKNAPLRTALANWLETTEAATWRNIQQVRRTFQSADEVPVRVSGQGTVIATVFNIKGNEYRLITTVNFDSATVVGRELLTHAEYNKNTWKARL